MIINNKILIGIVVVIVVVGSVFYFTQKQYQPSQQQPAATEQPQTQVAADTITIKNFSFTPDTLTVPQGTKVTWINQDPATHTITSDSFHSSDLNRGDSFDFTFTSKGTFDYSCSIHPSMKGKIVVE